MRQINDRLDRPLEEHAPYFIEHKRDDDRNRE